VDGEKDGSQVQQIQLLPTGVEEVVSTEAKALSSRDLSTPNHRNGQYRPASLCGHETALTHRKWAGFRMEEAYWSAMQEICACENITQAEFVRVAKSHRPNLSPAAAVRLGIVRYFIRRPEILPPGTLGAPSASVENLPEVPTTILVALHVLVVDDVAMNRDLASSFLRAAGHKVTCVEGGAQAIAAVQATAFGVVLMDVCMPEMDGLDATRQIRALGGIRGLVPIVALTARAFTRQMAECREAGMDSLVAKPFSPETLLTGVLRAAAAGSAHGADLILKTDGTSGQVTLATPVIDPEERPIFSRDVFDRSASFFTPEAVTSYLQNIAALAEALLVRLQGSDVVARAKDEIAGSVHSLTGSAGMFGFEHFAEIGRRFVQALESGSAEGPTLMEGFKGALKATLQEIQRHVPATIDD
jgi:CheY-like chemotaxis protein